MCTSILEDSWTLVRLYIKKCCIVSCDWRVILIWCHVIDVWYWYGVMWLTCDTDAVSCDWRVILMCDTDVCMCLLLGVLLWWRTQDWSRRLRWTALCQSPAWTTTNPSWGSVLRGLSTVSLCSAHQSCLRYMCGLRIYTCTCGSHSVFEAVNSCVHIV